MRFNPYQAKYSSSALSVKSGAWVRPCSRSPSATASTAASAATSQEAQAAERSPARVPTASAEAVDAVAVTVVHLLRVPVPVAGAGAELLQLLGADLHVVDPVAVGQLRGGRRAAQHLLGVRRPPPPVVEAVGPQPAAVAHH